MAQRISHHIKHQIEAIIDKVFKSYFDNNNLIFSNEGESKQFRYSTFNIGTKKWRKSKGCIYQGCKKRSIKSSHTIQKSASVKIISENGKVLTPVFDFTKGQLILKEIGINEASVFPGFCKEHENMFQCFEQGKKIEMAGDIQLQIYRTICREFVVKSHQLGVQKDRLEAYLKFRNTHLYKLVNSELNKLGQTDPLFKNMSLRSVDIKIQDWRYKKMEQVVTFIEKDLKKFKQQFYDRIHQDVLNNQATIKIIVVDVEKSFPVALAGRSDFFIQQKNKVARKVPVIMNILPFENNTKILIAFRQADKRAVQDYLNSFLYGSSVLKMLETWMVHGSDHWFITPSVWLDIPQLIKARITESIPTGALNIGQPISFDIFNVDAYS